MEKRNIYRVWWGIPKERDYLADVGIDGKITLKWIYKLAGMALD